MAGAGPDMDDRRGMRKRTRWRLGWPAVSALVAVLSVCALGGGYVAGRDAAVGQAAVDRKVLYDVDAKTAALADHMGDRIAVDAAQNARIELLERQHAELMTRLNSLIDLLWKDELSREARR